MRCLTLMALLLLPAQLAGQGPHPSPSPAKAFEIDLAQVKWTDFGPIQIAELYVDSVTGATQMLFRIPPNSTSPCHWHHAAESNLVVQGSAEMRHAGRRDWTALDVGGFSFVPKRMPHQIRSGPTLTIVFSTLDGRFDFNAVSDSQCTRG